MSNSKEFYKNYLADDNLVELNQKLVHEVLKENPNHVFEFGSGSGKNLKLIQRLQVQYSRYNIAVSGLDISLINCLHAVVKNGQQHISIGDETYLRHYCNYDIVITCSVIDHIQDIDGIIQELQRIANKCVILAECIEADEKNYYYAHDFTKYGFEKIKGSDYFSPADQHQYALYKWYKQPQITSVKQFVNGANDDLG